ncbi:MAG: hypothetical protein PWP51_338 [Clostridiales bacterium]|jgi:YjjI family glycine radical enzyme|nr:hypothetical protein [Clostridiales bacterium]MDN5297785.1 hypothetical protein [Clostridiales bacterium]
MKNEILKTIVDPVLTYEMKVNTLAKHAENCLDVLPQTEALKAYREAGIICDLFEGNAPYRPRYILPDYARFMAEGSAFLNLKPAEDLEDALNNLMILYRHVPSITTFPVFIGELDKLLEPYIEDEATAYRAIKRFLKYIDRTITDSFCHANIGPEATVAGRLILKAERELQDSIPNITLKYSAETPDDFAMDAIETSFITAKPSFANHMMFTEELGDRYAIASCYNGLSKGGGAFTLTRLVLSRLAEKTEDYQHFLKVLLPDVVKEMIGYIHARVDFIDREVAFFDHSFLVEEGLLDRNRFAAMFGLVGLAETVNHFQPSGCRYGHDAMANQMGVEIMDHLEALVKSYTHDRLWPDGHCMLHAQVGIDTDFGISPGVRIPIGEEPDLYSHLSQIEQFHKYFPSGVGDIFAFDETVERNPQYVLDIIKGAFKRGMRYVSFYGADADVIRITGYLVKKSEIEKLSKGEQVLRDTVVLGKGAVDNGRVLERKVTGL